VRKVTECDYAPAKLSPHAKGLDVVTAQGKTTLDQVDLAVNKTTRLVNKSYAIYLSLHQAVSGTEGDRNICKQFSPEIFDLIVVDECQRSEVGRKALRYYQGLFRIEREIEDLPRDERWRIRQRKSRRVLAVFHRGLLAQRPLVPPESATMKAIDYDLRR
jgi:Transposase IS66 family